MNYLESITKKMFTDYQKYKIGDVIRSPFGISFTVYRIRTMFDHNWKLVDIIYLDDFPTFHI
jgi:hypothetical protein